MLPAENMTISHITTDNEAQKCNFDSINLVSYPE